MTSAIKSETKGHYNIWPICHIVNCPAKWPNVISFILSHNIQQVIQNHKFRNFY